MCNKLLHLAGHFPVAHCIQLEHAMSAKYDTGDGCAYRYLSVLGRRDALRTAVANLEADEEKFVCRVFDIRRTSKRISSDCRVLYLESVSNATSGARPMQNASSLAGQ